MSGTPEAIMKKIIYMRNETITIENDNIAFKMAKVYQPNMNKS